jgi:hypothetical protein
MKSVSTAFLRGVVVLIALTVLALGILGWPWAREVTQLFPEAISWLGMAGVYAAAVPFLIALYQALGLLGLIDGNKAFSESSVKALKNIKSCALAMSVLLLFALPLAYRAADADDAPGGVVFWMVIAGAPLAVATFVGVLEKLFRNAVDMKSENDLTV